MYLILTEKGEWWLMPDPSILIFGIVSQWRRKK